MTRTQKINKARKADQQAAVEILKQNLPAEKTQFQKLQSARTIAQAELFQAVEAANKMRASGADESDIWLKAEIVRGNKCAEKLHELDRQIEELRG